MAVMKVWDGKQTHYIFHPENIVEIADSTKGVTLTLPVNEGEIGRQTYIYVITEKSARDVKREIQDLSDVPIGYLKLDGPSGLNRRRYINAKYIVSAKPQKVTRHTDGQQTVVDGAFLSIDHYDHHNAGLAVDMDPFEVARQIRRIIRRLDQDEDICCAAEAPDEDESE